MIPLVTILVAPDVILNNQIIDNFQFFKELNENDLKYYFAVFFLIMMFFSNILTFSNSGLFIFSK